MIDIMKLLFTAVLLTSSIAASATALCPPPEYPLDAKKNLEEGISLIGFFIKEDGTVGQTVLFSSTGYPELDQLALSTVQDCTFTPPAHKDGEASREWIVVAYKWVFSEDPGMMHARHVLATKGQNDFEALYQLSLILDFYAKTDQDREQARILRRRAAEMGQPSAQSRTGYDYEHGAEKDSSKALEWYRKAAAQGDVLAIERLKKESDAD